LAAQQSLKPVQQVSPQQPELVNPQFIARTGRPQPGSQGPVRQPGHGFGVQQLPAAVHTPVPVHEVGLQTQAVPAALQRGVVPPHETAQQTPPVPTASVSQLPLPHWASAPAVHAAPFPFFSLQVPASHQRPAPHAASFGQAPQVVAVSQ
jgi:hypothetical protein